MLKYTKIHPVTKTNQHIIYPKFFNNSRKILLIEAINEIRVHYSITLTNPLGLYMFKQLYANIACISYEIQVIY